MVAIRIKVPDLAGVLVGIAVVAVVGARAARSEFEGQFAVGRAGTLDQKRAAIIVAVSIYVPGLAGVLVGIVIVAIRVVADIAHWLCAILHGKGGIAVAIAVYIRIPGGSDAVVNQPVAIVVKAITDFGYAGVDGVVRVVAVIGERVTVAVRVGATAAQAVGAKGCKVAAEVEARVVGKVNGGHHAEVGEVGIVAAGELVVVEEEVLQTGQATQFKWDATTELVVVQI